MNAVVASLLEILKYTAPAVVVLLAAYFIVQRFLVNEHLRKQTALFHDTQKTTLPLRMQAYERLSIFVERIAPVALANRVYHPDMSVAVMRHFLTQTIHAEYEHNMSQQIYVSRQVWETVKQAKDQELSMINQIAAQMDGETPARELVARINDFVLSSEQELPSAIALAVISEEAKRVLSYGAAA